MTNLHVLTDHQITMLLKAAGYTDEDIAAMDRAAMESALDTNAEIGAASVGFPPAPEGEEEIYALLRHEGYTDQEISDMNDEERDAAVVEGNRDAVDEALMRAGFSEDEIEGMTDMEKMSNIDVNDVAMFETLHDLGYSDDDIGRMTDEQKADAVNLQTLTENEALREAGYYPEDMSPGAREDAMVYLAEHSSEYQVLGEDGNLLGLHDEESARPDPDQEDIDPYEEDPDDPEDEELTEDEQWQATEHQDDMTDMQRTRGSDSGFDDEMPAPTSTTVIDQRDVNDDVGWDGASRTEVTVMHGEGDDGSIPWHSEETKEHDIGIDGAHRSDTMVTTEEDEYGLRSTESSSDIGVDRSGANWDSEFHQVSLDNDGTVTTNDQERHVDVDDGGVDYSRTRDRVVVNADGSSTEVGDRSEFEANVDDGFHIGHGRTNITTDADGNVTGTDADIDLSADKGGVTFTDDFDSIADGGPLGDRSISRHVDVDLGLDGLDTSGSGSITLGGHTVDVGHDVEVGPRGISVEVGGQDLGLELPTLDAPPDLGAPPAFGGRPPIDGFDLPATIGDLPGLSLPDEPPPPPDDPVNDVVEVITDVVDDAPPPPPPPEEVVDAFEDGADAAGDALGGIFG
jgi:hypothetical protein